METFYRKSDLDAVFASFNDQIQALKEFEFEAPRPLPEPVNVYVPARTEAEALHNARHGYLIDGATKHAETQQLLDKRIDDVEAWLRHPNLVPIQPALCEWGILTGAIKPAEGGLSVGGHPIAPASYQPPNTLQAEIDAYINRDPTKGPGIV